MVGWPIPYLFTDLDTTAAVALLPLQLLWLNLMTDGLLGLAMGKEPAEPDVMRRPPHVPGGSLWAGGLGLHTAWIGFLIGAIALAMAIGYHEAGNPAWQSMLFTTLAFLQIGQAFALRSFHESLWKVGLRTIPSSSPSPAWSFPSNWLRCTRRWATSCRCNLSRRRTCWWQRRQA